MRNDTGQLWENYLIMERVKFLRYSEIYANFYFWCTYSGVEIDLIEERDGNLFAFEIKYGKRSSKMPVSWKKAYPDSEFSDINSVNFLEFIQTL